MAAHPGAALMLTLPWIAVFVLVSWWEMQRDVPSDWLGILVNVMMVPAIALPWHRRILPSQISEPGQKPGLRAYGFYLLEWLIIGIIISVIAALLAVPLWLFFSFLFEAIYLSNSEFYYVGEATLLAVGAIVVWPITYVAHRLSFILPHWALRAKRMTVRAAWQKTGRISKALWVTAAFVSVPIAVLTLLGFVLPDIIAEPVFDEESGGYLGVEPDIFLLMYWGVEGALCTLVGASIMTEVYREVEGTELDMEYDPELSVNKQN